MWLEMLDEVVNRRFFASLLIKFSSKWLSIKLKTFSVPATNGIIKTLAKFKIRYHGMIFRIK